MPPHPAFMAKFGEAQDLRLDAAGDADFLEVGSGERGKNGYGEDGWLGAGLRGSLGCGLQHFGAARGMDGEERDSERGCAADGAGYGVRDVVKLEVEEDLLTAGHQVADKRGANGGEKLLAYLIEADGFAKLRDQSASLLHVGDIERNDQTISAILHGNRITHGRPTDWVIC